MLRQKARHLLKADALLFEPRHPVISFFLRTGGVVGVFVCPVGLLRGEGVPRRGVPAAGEAPPDPVQNGLHQVEPQVPKGEDDHKRQKKRADFLPGHSLLLRGEPIHKEVGEGGQLLLLRHLDIQ